MPMKARYTVIDREIVSETRNGVTRDYVPDPLGSTVALLDSSHNKTDTFTYWPYGEERTRTGTTATPFRWLGVAGYYKVFSSSDLNYVRARVADPRRARWLTRDPLESGLFSESLSTKPILDEPGNPYAVARGNPTTWRDPSGLGVEKDFEEWTKCYDKCKKHLPDRHSFAACMIDCYSKGYIDRNCSSIICYVKPEFCSAYGGDPCKYREVRVDACQDCCAVKYLCCLMKIRNSVSHVKCYRETCRCHARCVASTV